MNAKQVFTQLLFTLGLTSSALADVNLQQASYYKTWTDFSIESKGLKYSFQRTYRSRSIHQGLFGFGWCSDFEKKLEILGPEKIVLKDCQEERTLLYKKRGKDFVSIQDPKDKITRAGSRFHRQKGLIQQVFDPEGRLIELKYFKWPLQIFYGSDQRISQIKINHDQVINLKFTPRDGDSLTVTAPRKAAFVYHFKDKNLISVTTASGSKIFYQYNSAHNLTRVTRDEKTLELMSYDDKKDWLLEASDDSRCKKTFSYYSDPKKILVFKTRVQKFCEDSLTEETLATYELQEIRGGGYRVSKVFTQTHDLKTRIATKNGEPHE